MYLTLLQGHRRPEGVVQVVEASAGYSAGEVSAGSEASAAGLAALEEAVLVEDSGNFESNGFILRRGCQPVLG